MSFISGLSGTPHLVDKGVEKDVYPRPNGVEISGIRPLTWDTAFDRLTLSTFSPEVEGVFHLGKELLIHKLRLAITTNIYQ
jgi:hypothetical protein